MYLQEYSRGSKTLTLVGRMRSNPLALRAKRGNYNPSRKERERGSIHIAIVLYFISNKHRRDIIEEG
jgi:hypothetical protein